MSQSVFESVAPEHSQPLYRSLCQEQVASLPIFFQDWWLDTVTDPMNWNALVLQENGETVAALPYTLEHRKGFSHLGQPPLTQFLGPWIHPAKKQGVKAASKQKQILTALAQALHAYDTYQQSWGPLYQDWLPFFWQGFTQTTRYTYRLNTQSPDTLWQGLQSNIRREIKKAQNRYRLEVYSPTDPQVLIPLIEKTFHRQDMGIPKDKTFFERLFKRALQQKQGQMFVAKDPENKDHAGVFVVWDQQTTYYLIGGGDPELRTSGASSLCLWEAIQFSRNHTPIFDFEGSMIEPIERYFRAFGGEQTPYHSLSKVSSKSLKSIRLLKDLVKLWR